MQALVSILAIGFEKRFTGEKKEQFLVIFDVPIKDGIFISFICFWVFLASLKSGNDFLYSQHGRSTCRSKAVTGRKKWKIWFFMFYFFLGWTKSTGGQPQFIIKTIDCMIIFEESSNWKSNSMILFFHPSVLFLLKMCAKTKSWFLGSFNFWFGFKQTHLFFNRYSAFFFFFRLTKFWHKKNIHIFC